MLLSLTLSYPIEPVLHSLLVHVPCDIMMPLPETTNSGDSEEISGVVSNFHQHQLNQQERKITPISIHSVSPTHPVFSI